MFLAHSCFCHNLLETARNVTFLGAIPLHFARRTRCRGRRYQSPSCSPITRGFTWFRVALACHASNQCHDGLHAPYVLMLATCMCFLCIHATMHLRFWKNHAIWHVFRVRQTFRVLGLGFFPCSLLFWSQLARNCSECHVSWCYSTPFCT